MSFGDLDLHGHSHNCFLDVSQDDFMVHGVNSLQPLFSVRTENIAIESVSGSRFGI